MDTKEKYDLIFSLGGNCAAAHNLRYRKLRKFSLPFDWTYITDEFSLYKLADGFKTKFDNFLIKENLQELKKEEFNDAHKDKIQYKDTLTGYYFVNHFNDTIDNIEEYKKVKSKFDKRIKRLYKFIEKSNRILLILSVNFPISDAPVIYLLNVLREKYPEKNFFIKVLSYSAKEIKEINNNNIQINYFTRSQDTNDFINTTKEWSFLDNIEYNPSMLNIKFGCLIIDKLKRGYSFVFFPKINTIFYIKLYIFGLRLNIALGKIN